MAESEVFRIHEGRLRDAGPEPVVPLLTRAVERIEALYSSRNPITGLPTGFDDLDKKTAGLQPSDLIIVAGRPSMGKTSFAMNMVEHALMTDAPGAVLVFSMEMPSEQTHHADVVVARPHRSDAHAHRRHARRRLAAVHVGRQPVEGQVAVHGRFARR